jgi:hypothetical protein
MLFQIYHCDSSYYFEGVRYSSETAMHEVRTEKAKNELTQELKIKDKETISKKLKV